MAGVGEFYTLSQSELCEAFEAAKANGQDYLVKISYGVDGGLTGMPGFGFVLDLIDFHQAALPVRTDTVREDFRAFLDQYGGGSVLSVYDLSREFDTALVSEDTLDKTVGVFEDVRKQYNADMYQQSMDARPLWRKVLGLQPK